MAAVFLFTGENAFALRQEKRRWTAEFVAKHGSENLLQLDGSEITLRSILDEVSASPFIGDKRLVIIQKLPKWTKDEMKLLIDAVHPSSILLFSDPAPDKRTGGYKELVASATIKEFSPLRGKMLRDWVISHAQRSSCQIQSAAIDTLLMIVGEDQDMLSQEIAKLALLGRPVTVADVRTLAVPSGEQEVWQLSTLISRGDLEGALAYTRTLMRSGEDPYSLWNILLWLVRSLAGVVLCVNEGERSPGKIASLAGVPPMTAKMLTPMAQSIPLSSIRELVSWAVAADRDLKTGGYKATGEAPQEIIALMEELVVRCCRLSGERVA